MTTFYRRLRMRPETADSIIGYLTILILGWLWLPALVDLLIGG